MRFSTFYKRAVGLMRLCDGGFEFYADGPPDINARDIAAMCFARALLGALTLTHEM